ncbi:hypothetical protein JOF53_004592 [Crossiella equi]|uniref:Uncharacterized protein n=1 Tax=Crossiella equi TaxID=130796 RepID=A0ABS5AJ45_9PSEU|nr:hypothetical protein [Crossiella equi]MBP2475720.1 hypothetical protein [Crossiella equi]
MTTTLPERAQAPAGLRFCLADTNPLTGRAYYQSRFRDLPEVVAQVVKAIEHIQPWRWDEMVGENEVGEYAHIYTTYLGHPSGVIHVEQQDGATRAVVDIDDNGGWF